MLVSRLLMKLLFAEERFNHLVLFGEAFHVLT